MSLIKIAFLLANPVGTLTAISPGFLAAKSGDPIKWFFKNDLPFLNIRRQISQPAALSTFSHSINRLRQGYTTDSTAVHSALVDAAMGSMMNFSLGAAEKEMKNNKIFKHVLNKVIDNEGKYNIPQIEEYLKRSKQINNITKDLNTKNYGLYGAGIGAGIGALNKDDNESMLWSSAKSGVKGGLLGLGAKKGVEWLNEGPVGMAAKVHDIYFKSPYWKNQLTRANKLPFSRIGKEMSTSFTSLPEDRERRIKNFNRIHDFFHQDIKDIFKKKD